MLEHLESLYTFYGEFQGVRIARKHMGWYFDRTEGPVNACATFNQQISAENQKALIRQLFREHPIGYRP